MTFVLTDWVRGANPMNMVARHIGTSPYRGDPNRVPRIAYNVVDPNDVRATLLRDGFAAAGIPAPITVSACEAFRAPEHVVAQMEPHGILRFDSPRRSAEVNSELFRAGEIDASSEGSPSTVFENRAWADGGFLGPRQWYLGFARLLQRSEHVPRRPQPLKPGATSASAPSTARQSSPSSQTSPAHAKSGHQSTASSTE